LADILISSGKPIPERDKPFSAQHTHPPRTANNDHAGHNQDKHGPDNAYGHLIMDGVHSAYRCQDSHDGIQKYFNLHATNNLRQLVSFNPPVFKHLIEILHIRSTLSIKLSWPMQGLKMFRNPGDAGFGYPEQLAMFS
jgi:hypothetical protein